MVLVAALAVLTLGACGSAPSSSRAKTAGSIVLAPVQTVQTKLGPVAYRSVGSGPPLVLIMGYAGTMQTWDPLFVDALATRHRVVTFDNAGIGATAALSSPLTGPLSIDAMADQTGDLIRALHLGRPDVLGWSMGGMIAQALAVRHPDEVDRLVLCATFPGGGHMVLPSQSEISALTSGNAQLTAAALFPANQRLAFDAMSAELGLYPTPEQASATTIAAQAHASLQWFDGRDGAGREAARIGAPTLIADGTQDRLDAVANDVRLHNTIRGSRLVLYPDAGHAFLFQEGAPFNATVMSFLAPSTPLPKAAIARELLTGQVTETRIGRRWIAALARLRKHPASGSLAQVDAPLAGYLTMFDGDLLDAGAAGALGRAITAFATAEERVATDIAALGGLSRTQGASWGVALKAAGTAALRADNALRRLLGLAPVAASGAA